MTCLKPFYVLHKITPKITSVIQFVGTNLRSYKTTSFEKEQSIA